MMPQLPTLLRPARHEDCPQILRVHRHAVRYSCLKSYTPEIMNAWLDLLEPESYLDPIDNPNKALWLIEYENQIQGFFLLNYKKHNWKRYMSTPWCIIPAWAPPF